MRKTRSFLQRLGYPVEKPLDVDEALYAATWFASRAQRRVAKALKAFALTPVKLNYLMVVKHIGGKEGLSQREIGKRLLIDPGNVTHVLDDLERLGWMIRDAGPDRRSHRIRITPRGSRLLDEVWPVYKKATQELTGCLAVADGRKLIEIFSQWRQALEERA